MTDLAGIYSKACGKDVKFVQCDVDKAQAMFKSRGCSDWYSKSLGELYQGITGGAYDHYSDDVEQILKRKPKTFGEFLEEHNNVGEETKAPKAPPKIELQPEEAKKEDKEEEEEEKDDKEEDGKEVPNEDEEEGEGKEEDKEEGDGEEEED